VSTDNQRMSMAREAWRTAAPDADEVRRGAERVARRLRVLPQAPLVRPIFVSLGAGAACLAALAYAGIAGWSGLHRAGTHDPAVVATAESATALPTLPSLAASPPNIQFPPEPAPGPAAATVTVPLNEKNESHASDEPIRPHSVTAARSAVPERKESPVPSWAEVKDALGGGDEKRAQTLLSDLARRGNDADDRAKAKLGLAQLEASHGNCAEARILAMQVAALQGIELKTVRRALELAARCTR
jgi:hypothetical protein